MDSRASTRTRLSVLPVLIALLANLLAIAPVGMGGASSVLATHVAPVFKPGNPTCGSFGDYDHEFRINAPASATFSDPNSDFEVTLTLNSTAAGQTMDFVANLPVDAVFVKGGPNGNLYTYDPPGPAVTSDTGLHSPVNPSNGQYFGISHVSFCFDDVPLLPDLEIEKTPDNGIVNAGDPVSFTITVTNAGDAAALNVDIDDTLPSGFAWTDNKAECSITGTALHCDIASLAADASFSVTVTAPTDGSQCGEFPNVAFADADGIDQISDPGKNTINCADIRIEKTPDGGDVEIGGAITFVLTVFNDGIGEARGVTVSDALDGSGWSIVAAGTTLTGCVLTGSNLTCGPDTIGGSASRKVTVTRTAVFDADCGRIDNTASVDTSNDGDDSDTGHVTVLCADIEVDKSPDDADVTAGDPATFAIVTSNAGAATATGVELADDLPIVALGWAIVDAQTDWASCAIAGDAGEQQTLTCGPESIAAGGDLTVTVTTTATADDCGLLDNPAAEVAASNDGSDSDGGDITVLCADIDVVKTPDGGEAQAGDEATFTIVTSNGGDGTAADSTLTDDLPAVANGWTVDTENWAGDCSITGDAGGGQTLTCGPEDIEAGGDRTVTVTTTVTTNDCGALDNLAEVGTSNDGSASDPGDITVLCPAVDVDKTPDDAEVQAGDGASFAIVTTNGGDGVAAGATLTDDLPAVENGWAIESEDWAGDCSITGDAGAVQTLTCGPEEIEAGGDRSVTVTTTTTPDDCGELPNLAEVEIDNGDGAGDTGDMSVLCPDIVVAKSATDEEISAGELAEFTIATSNAGDGIAKGATLTDDLPAVANGWTISSEDWAGECSVTGATGAVQTLTCGPEDIEAGGDRSVTVSTETTEQDCDLLENLAEASASNEDDGDLENNADDASILVACPGLNILKTADDGEVVAGEEASFTITVWNEGPGTAFDVTLHDDLPAGLAWEVEVTQGTAECDVASSVEEGGVEQRSLDCDLGDLAPVASASDGVKVRVFAETDQDDCGPMANTAFADASNDDEDSSEAELTVRCPQLVIDKVADAEVITISGPNDDLVADPSVVTWTLTYTLTDGPVTNAVITDEVLEGFEFLDASDGGHLVGGVVTWTFPSLAESGSVTFRTTVDPETISRVAPTVNVAVIDSDETEPDDGEDSVTVVVEPPPLGGTPTPRPSLPDTAVGIGPNSEPITVPLELMAALFLGSLGVLAMANARARARRR